MKTVITTDLHGCSLEFRALLKQAGLMKSEDTLIVLGDLFDRGKHSFEVYREMQALRSSFWIAWKTDAISVCGCTMAEA